MSVLNSNCKDESQNKNKVDFRSCDECPMSEFENRKVTKDSTYSKSTDGNLVDFDIEFKLNRFKEYFDLEVSASKEQGYTTDIRTGLREVSRQAPELILPAYEVQIKHLMFCTYYKIWCRDTTLSDKTLSSKSEALMDEIRIALNETFKARFENDLMKDQPNGAKIKKSNNFSSNKSTTNIEIGSVNGAVITNPTGPIEINNDFSIDTTNNE